MDILLIICEAALLVWFFGCIVTYKIGKKTLVDGMGVKSAEFVMLVLYTLSALLNAFFPLWGRYVLLTVLTFWLVVQFFCHWYYTIFGASEKKLRGYNKCFKDTVKLFPPSETRVVPDLYHTLLHLLIILNIVLLIIKG